ncbi:hypothetical protein LP417_13320 [Polaromonas sp. P1-6]|nr:hypothetical protein LP417_13320 [Polaromonas sp. P1-6]
MWTVQNAAEIGAALGVAGYGETPINGLTLEPNTTLINLPNSSTGSSGLISYANDYSVRINVGGTLSHIVAAEAAKGNVISVADLRAVNYDIRDVADTAIPSGAVLLVPKRVGESLVVDSGNARISFNPTTGEYLAITQSSANGPTFIYERKLVDGTLVDRFIQTDSAINGLDLVDGNPTTLPVSLTDLADHTGGSLTIGDERTGSQLTTLTSEGNGNYGIIAEIGGQSVSLGAVADNGSDNVRVTGISSINGQAVDNLGTGTYGLDTDDYLSFGLTFNNLLNGTVGAAGEALIAGLSPATQATIGAPVPQLQVTPLAEGQSYRSLEVAGGATFSTLRDDEGNVISATYSRELGAGVKVSEVYDAANTLLYTEKIEPVLNGANAGQLKETLVRPDGSGFVFQRGADGREIANTRVLVQPFDQRLASTFSDIPSFINAIKGGHALPVVASGLKLLNSIDQLATPGGSLPQLGTANTIAAGALSLYNLSNALKHGDTFDKINASVSALNATAQAVAVITGQANAITSFFGQGGAGVGVLPALGLLSAIKSGDPIGMAQSIGLLVNPAFLSTPLGWVLTGVQILRALSAKGPPDAWGTANVTFGPGITNYLSQVNATGENFGPDRVRGQLQNTLDSLNGIINQANSGKPDSNQHLGLIPQRLPSLNYRAAEFADKGYSVTDIDALTGAQRAHFLRFDDQGKLFSALPEQMTPEVRAMLYLDGASNVPALTAYMLNSALDRQAIAPMWEVKTAKMQQEAGDPNAGLTEEERAAKAGHAAPLDAAYAAAHSSDPEAKNKRAGHFMAVGLDLNGDGYIMSRTIAQNAAAGTAISFDWDGQGYQKKTGWIGAQDGFLMLDHNFNQSADNAKELLSNPLIADAGKGLRVLAAYDANGDGKIDASDPVYHQLKVWQDLNQDGNNTQVITVGSVQALAQDESGGQKELKSLQEAGISAIDYGNGRYEFNSASSANGVGYGQIATQALEAESEGTRYTPVGAGIQIELSNGTPQIVITQVLSEQAVYQGLQIAASGETIGVPGAELYEDGLPYGYNPNSQGGQREIVISAAQLLANDTWAGMAGVGAGLAITNVRGGAHIGVSVRADGDISLRLESNYHGAAEFFYTVAVPGQQAVVAPQEARVMLNITAVNDAPLVTNSLSPERAIYGYSPLGYQYVETIGLGENSVQIPHSGTARGLAQYEPYVEHIPSVPIYERQLIGDNYENVFIGYTQEQHIPHYEVIATDKPNTGRVIASDPDGGSFTYQLLGQPAYGAVSLDAAGNWSYTGRRPEGYLVPDVTGDGAQDLLLTGTALSVGDALLYGYPNIDSNRYAPDERTFLDYFTVRVYDNTDPTGQTFKDVEIAATHYGPPPHPTIADSGGGKKPIAIDLDGNGFHFTDVDDSNVFFDVNGDGWKRRMAWTSPGDGLLAFDKDGDGKITSFDEISFVPLRA